MTIEQTDQLISLILNSVLMMLLSALLLSGAWLRQQFLVEQLEQISVRYRQLTQMSAEQTGLGQVATGQAVEPAARVSQARGKAAALKQVRDRRLRLRSQYRWSYAGMLVLHAALIVFGVSLLSLALRSLLVIDALVSVGLFLFVAGAIGLLSGISFSMVDVAKGSQQVGPLPQLLGQGLKRVMKLWHRLARRPAAVRNAALLMPARPPSSDRSVD